MELQKRVKSNGKVEFRTKFERDKVAVLSKDGDYFYINLYDNLPKYKGNKIFFGVDEIEELVRIKGAIDALKPEFDQHVSATTTQYLPITEAVSPALSVAQPHSSIPVESVSPASHMTQPLHSVQNIPVVIGQQRRQNVAHEEVPPKKVKLNDLANTTIHLPSYSDYEYTYENVPAELLDDFLM